MPRTKTPHRSSLLHALRSGVALLAPLTVAGLTACGGGEEPPPPAPPSTTAVFDLTDPCGDAAPAPSDFFVDADGQPEDVDCPLPSDPILAAVTRAQRFDGTPVSDVQATIPLEGSLDPRTLGSTVSFALTGGSTLASEGPLPVAVMLEQTGTATDATGWDIVESAVSFADGKIRVRASRELAYNTFHVVVLTTAPQDNETPSNHLGVSPAVKALLGDSEISAGAYEGLDADSAARLERMRQALAPLVPILAQADPPLTAENIASIHGFTTEKGPAHLTEAVEDYFDAIDAGRYTRRQENRVVPFSEVYPGLPAIAYEGVSEFRYGTIEAPRLLDDEGHLRANWTEQVETIQIPYSLSIPARSERYGVAVFVPGWGRGKIDGRALAPKMAQAASAAVLTIDLRCHGDRSMDGSGLCMENRSAQEIAALPDAVANNGNPEIMGADGIPDTSGQGFFPADPRALRDSQIAAIIEVLHVLESVREGTNVFGAPLNFNVGQIHVIAQGYMAPAALGAIANIRFPPVTMTLQLPAGGAGYRELIVNGPDDLRDSFISSAPQGIDPGTVGEYLSELERTVLAPLDVEAFADAARERLTRRPNPVRILLNHGRVPEFVTEDARDNLIDALSLSASRRSQHNPTCDDFFIYTCDLGDNPAWLEEARGQFATFVSSEGITVSAPAP